MVKRKIKFRFLALLFVIIALIAPFVIWVSLPGKYLNIVVINKTFPVETNVDGEIVKLDYSKQRGLYWLMNYLGIKNPETNNTYKVDMDYYGNFLDEGKLVNRPFKKLDTVPELIFLSDMYGTGDSRMNGEEAKGISGMTKEEVGLVSTYYAKGTTVIGEYNIAGDPTRANVSKELEGIFGVSFTGVAGKFFSELSSNEDVPNWIRVIYEQQYGKRWDVTGAGIVIAGNNRIVVLQREVGFVGSSIQIAISEDHDDDYGTEVTDYYNWFEIVEPAEDTSVIAWYNLNLTDEGKKQLEPFGLTNQFPAIIMKHSDRQKSYYLAGDFTDYRGPERINQFSGATALYKFFSVKSEGDLSYFYWHFYVPLMSNIIKDIEPLDQEAFQAVTEGSDEGAQLVSRIADKQLEVYQNGKWTPIYINGVDIGPTAPGYTEGALPSDPALYSDWFEQIADMNANTIRVYTLMPSVFYRALENHNDSHPDKQLHLLQNITIDQEYTSGNYLDSTYHSAFEQAVENTIDAIHGNASIQAVDASDSDSYVNDVSRYLLGYLIDPDLNLDYVSITDSSNLAYHFEGEYVSAEDNATPTEAWLASISNKAYEYEEVNYSMQHPIGIVSIPDLDTGYQHKYSPVGQAQQVSIDLNRMVIGDKVISGFFTAYRIFPDQPGLMLRKADGAQPDLSEYKEYLNHLIIDQSKYPLLVSEVGVPTSGNITEAMQGEEMVALLKIIRDSGAMGGLVYEWVDEWGQSSKLTAPLMIPNERGVLWHNTVDPAQNYGIVSLESSVPADYSMNLRGSGPLDSLSLTADESYFYIKAEMNTLPDFNEQKIQIYLDTIDRKNGEYMLAPDVNENWSGVEFKINIEDLDKAELLVIPNYNVSKGSYYTSVSTDGVFERMMRVLTPEYTTQSGKKISATYEDGSTLMSGNFENSDSHFYFESNTLYVRIPWIRLNFSDPSSLLVLHDEKAGNLPQEVKDTLSVRMTDGIVTSLVVMKKGTDQVEYRFPESVTSSGYRTYSWNTWDIPQVVSRNKTSYEKIKEFFADHISGSEKGIK